MEIKWNKKGRALNGRRRQEGFQRRATDHRGPGVPSPKLAPMVISRGRIDAGAPLEAHSLRRTDAATSSQHSEGPNWTTQLIITGRRVSTPKLSIYYQQDRSHFLPAAFPRCSQENRFLVVTRRIFVLFLFVAALVVLFENCPAGYILKVAKGPSTAI